MLKEAAAEAAAASGDRNPTLGLASASSTIMDIDAEGNVVDDSETIPANSVVTGIPAISNYLDIAADSVADALAAAEESIVLPTSTTTLEIGKIQQEEGQSDEYQSADQAQSSEDQSSQPPGEDQAQSNLC